MMLVTFCLSWIWPTGTIPDTSVVHQQQKFAVCVRSSDQGDVNCSSIIFSLTAVLMLGGGPFKFNPPHPPTTPLKNKTKTNYLCWTVTRFCELARQSMNLNLIAGSFSRMRFLLSWGTIRANQLWTQSFHKSCFRTAARVPSPLPVPPHPFPKRNYEYRFCCDNYSFH